MGFSFRNFLRETGTRRWSFYWVRATLIKVQEAFTTRDVLRNLSGIQLVILGDLIPLVDVSNEVLWSALDRSLHSIPHPDKKTKCDRQM